MKVVAICSGGLDSTVMYFDLLAQGHEVLPVNFEYGAKHNSAERKCVLENIPGVKQVSIDLLHLKSALLKGGEKIPHGHYQEESMKSTVVPFRNGIMLAYAVAVAESENAQTVALGSHAGDHAIYPDCRPEFTKSFSEAATLGTYAGIQVLAPYSHMTKAQIVSRGKSLQIPPTTLAKTWSCYEGKAHHCGECGACVERQEAFMLSGVVDLTQYVVRATLQS